MINIGDDYRGRFFLATEKRKAWNFFLDNTVKLWYNTLIELVRKVYKRVVNRKLLLTYTIRYLLKKVLKMETKNTVTELIASGSINKEKSQANLEIVQKWSEIIAKAWQECYPGTPSPIIAGGCVRDVLVGCNIKDIDVFIDGTVFTKFDMDGDDGLTLLTEKVMELGDLKPEQVGRGRRHVADSYTGMSPEGAFKAYDIYDLFTNDEDPVLQFISRPDMEGWGGTRLTDDFDYDLVKGFVNLDDLSINITEGMQKSFESRTIVCNTAKAYDRVHQWRQRTRMTSVFKCTQPYKKKKLDYQQHDKTLPKGKVKSGETVNIVAGDNISTASGRTFTAASTRTITWGELNLAANIWGN